MRRLGSIIIKMAVVGVLTNRSGALVEFKHDLHPGESSQENKINLQNLVHSVRKLQNDVNSCLTKIIEEEKTSSTAMRKGKCSDFSCFPRKRVFKIS